MRLRLWSDCNDEIFAQNALDAFDHLIGPAAPEEGLLVGIGLGASLALRIAIERKSRVQGLALVAPDLDQIPANVDAVEALCVIFAPFSAAPDCAALERLAATLKCGRFEPVPETDLHFREGLWAWGKAVARATASFSSGGL